MDTKFKRIKKNLNIPRVLLVRHGATNLNNKDKSKDRIRGWIDHPLNDEGRGDAERARKKLQGTKIDAIFSSDLSRARETADIINQDHKAPVIETGGLRPWNLGKFQGKPTDQVIDQVNRHIDNPDTTVPDGETFNEFRLRYLHLLDKIIRQAIKEKQTIMIATHLRNLKLADGWVQNGMPRDFSVDPDIVTSEEFDPGDIYELPVSNYIKARKQ